jgi:hypothetical protein
MGYAVYETIQSGGFVSFRKGKAGNSDQVEFDPFYVSSNGDSQINEFYIGNPTAIRYWTFSFGSNASRSPSPNKLNPRIVKEIAAPGPSAGHTLCDK